MYCYIRRAHAKYLTERGAREETSRRFDGRDRLFYSGLGWYGADTDRTGARAVSFGGLLYMQAGVSHHGEACTSLVGYPQQSPGGKLRACRPHFQLHV